MGDLGRNLESLQGLRARAGGVAERNRLAVAYTADFTSQEIEKNLLRLERSGLLAGRVAKVRTLVDGYRTSVRKAIGAHDRGVKPGDDAVLDPEYVPVRVAVAELGQLMSDAAARSGRNVNLLSWLFYPILMMGCGIMVVRNAQTRKIAVQRTTEQREAAKFEAMVGTSHDVITVLGLDGAFRYVSPAAKTVFGRSAGELMEGRFVDAARHDGHQPTARCRPARFPVR